MALATQRRTAAMPVLDCFRSISGPVEGANALASELYMFQFLNSLDEGTSIGLLR
jgi:hypothetical protein